MSATSMNNRTLPFAIRLDRSRPNARTSAATDEGDVIIASGKSRFNTPEEMFADLAILNAVTGIYTIIQGLFVGCSKKNKR